MSIKGLPNDLAEAVSGVMHPAINFSLIELGIVKEITADEKTVYVTFAFPFPNIPIEGALVNSIAEPVKQAGFGFDHTIIIMSEQEKAKFMEMEQQAWRGL